MAQTRAGSLRPGHRMRVPPSEGGLEEGVTLGGEGWFSEFRGPFPKPRRPTRLRPIPLPEQNPLQICCTSTSRQPPLLAPFLVPLYPQLSGSILASSFSNGHAFVTPPCNLLLGLAPSQSRPRPSVDLEPCPSPNPVNPPCLLRLRQVFNQTTPLARSPAPPLHPESWPRSSPVLPITRLLPFPYRPRPLRTPGS